MFLCERKEIESKYLERTVLLDCFLPTSFSGPLSLLLINDGQNMEELGLHEMLNTLGLEEKINPAVFAVAIHAGDRMMEYGTAAELDYMGRGYKAPMYVNFVLKELIPFLQDTFGLSSFKNSGIAGFSLGGLSAMDIAWANPDLFRIAGVFSGSLWWRRRGLDEGYVEDLDRIMHSIVRQGKFVAGQKFYFETGALDETMDRNHNGIIDSIDDTLGLIDELVVKGYDRDRDIRYFEIEDGRHDIATWARAMPDFLIWAFGVESWQEV